MNVRKGFLRFYIVLALAWVALWLYVLRPIQRWPETGDVVYYKYIRYEDKLIPVAILNQLSSCEKAKLARLWMKDPANYQITDTELFALTDHKAYGLSLDEYRDNVLLLLGVKTYTYVWVSSLWQLWRRSLIVAFLPPVFFYFLFFYVGRWVYRGFKRDQQASVA